MDGRVCRIGRFALWNLAPWVKIPFLNQGNAMSTFSTQFDADRAIRNAVAHQRLEGVEADPRTISELHRVAKGEIQFADVIRHLKQRIASGDFQKPA